MNNNKPFSKYSNFNMHTELASLRQVQRTSKDGGNSWNNLDEREWKQLKRSQFAFGTLYPYTFDGLAYIATHHKELIKNKDDYYYMLELPIDNFCHYCLLEWHGASNAYLRSELLKRDKNKNEYEFLKYIPFAKGDYVSLDPIRIGFHHQMLTEIPNIELKRLKNLKTFTNNMKIVNTIIIYILKPLLAPIIEESSSGGFFSVPSALQAKIDYTIQADKQKHFAEMKPLVLRKYFMYLNSHNGSKNTNHIVVNAVDLWEHVSPSEININNGYKYLRDWEKARRKLETAHEFFTAMETKGLMIGAKAYPSTEKEEDSPHFKGVFYLKDTKEYIIYYKPGKKAIHKIL